MPNQTRNISFIALIAAMIMAISSCGNADKKKPVDVMVSIEPLRFVTEQIAGDRMSVGVLVPGGSSPETYEPTPQQMMNLSGSKLYLSIGSLGFEQTWLEKISKNIPSLHIASTSEGIDAIRSSGGIPDPHTWTSPRNLKRIAQNVCNELCLSDSAGAEYYKNNLDTLNSKIDHLDSEIHKILAHSGNRSFVIYHPALTYFAHDYGLIQIALEEEGKEPTPSQIHSIIARCREEGVKVIFVQKEFNQANARTIAKSTGAQIISIDPLNHNILDELRKIANQLK